MKPRLLVVPNDPLEAYDNKGYSREERNKYFNPADKFNVSILEVPLYKSRFSQFAGSEYAGFPVFVLDEHLTGIEEVLTEINPEIVRGYGESGKVISSIKNIRNIPSVLSVHDLQPTDAIFSADRVFCVSEAVKNRCVARGLDPSKIRILLDRVDTGLFRDYRGSEELDVLRKKYPARYITVSAGRLVWEKNIERLIEATEIVREKLGDYCHIHLGNSGDLKDSIEAKASSSPHFKLLPNQSQEELAGFYSLADAFVMASLSEGFGLVYIEALACGTPVVTSNNPPMADYVNNRLNGLLVNPTSPEDIAEKTLEILTNPGLNAELRDNARLTVKRFDSKLLERREAELYFELLNGWRRDVQQEKNPVYRGAS